MHWQEMILGENWPNANWYNNMHVQFAKKIYNICKGKCGNSEPVSCVLTVEKSLVITW